MRNYDGSQAGPTRAVENINTRAGLSASGGGHVREDLANCLRNCTTWICIGNDLRPRGGQVMQSHWTRSMRGPLRRPDDWCGHACSRQHSNVKFLTR